MKAGILTVWIGEGKVLAVADESMDAVTKLARKVRADRTIDIGGKPVTVIMGAVSKFNGTDSTIVQRFNCRAEANREAIIKREADVKVKAAKDAEKAAAKAAKYAEKAAK
jgi:hypothetical protein